MTCVCADVVHENYGFKTVDGIIKCNFCLKPLRNQQSLLSTVAPAPTFNHQSIEQRQRLEEIKSQMTDVEKLHFEMQEKTLELLTSILKSLESQKKQIVNPGVSLGTVINGLSILSDIKDEFE